MAVMVEEVMPSKSGKALRVKLGGTWYNAFLDSGLNGMRGQMIEAEIQTNEKFGPSIKGWKPVAAPQVPPPPQGGFPPAPAPAVAAPVPYNQEYKPVYAGEPGNNVQPWWGPFASNTVAHAIQAGLIKDPVAINQWYLKAAQCAVAAKNEVER